MTYGWCMFENMAAWVVLVLFAIGLWLTGHALWGMAADARARAGRK
ncbi:MAG: hypothetical protein ACKOEM_02360 [Planctomycetia bacterium]